MTKTRIRARRPDPRMRAQVLAAAAGLAASLPSVALAQPTGASVQSGNVSIGQSGSTTTITASNNAIINYQTFSINAGHTVQFVQPGASARVLNRVVTNTPSNINGNLLANGIVYLINPAGVQFGPGAVVNVGELFAAAGNLSNEDFLGGVNRFTDIVGPVINYGNLSASGGVSLVGQYVANHGSINAGDNHIIMASGSEVLIGERFGSIYARVEGADASLAAEAAQADPNYATGAQRLGSGDVYSLAAWNAGDLVAARVQIESAGGAAIVTGSIDASSSAAGSTGGSVAVLGQHVGLYGADIDASGVAAGGTVNIGGAFQGGDSLRASQSTVVDASSSIRADATGAGTGGEVVLWSDGATDFQGSISAAGSEGGGLIEVSGKRDLTFGGDVYVPQGTLLLDPDDIVILEGDGSGIEDDLRTAGVFEITQAELEAMAIMSGADDVILMANNTFTIEDLLDFNVADTLTLTAAAGTQFVFQAGGEFIMNTGDSINVVGGGGLTIEAGAASGGLGTISAGDQLTLSIDAGLNTANGLSADLITINSSGVDDGLRAIVGGDVFIGGPLVGGDLVVNVTGFFDASNAANDHATVQGTAGTDFTYVDANDLGLSGSLSAGTGTVDLTSVAGSLTLDQNVTAGTDIVVTAATDVTGAGVLTGMGLDATATGGSVSLSSASNAFGTVTGQSLNSFTLSESDGFSVGAGGVGSTNGGVMLMSGGTIDVANAIDAANGMVVLDSTAGDISGAGVITTGDLMASAAGGSISLTGNNQASMFMGVAMGDLLMNNVGSLDVHGAMAGGSISLTSTAGSLTANGPGPIAAGTTVALSGDTGVSGTAQISGTDLSANSASGSVSLTNASNSVSTVQGSGSTGFEYVNDGDLALSGAVDGGTGDVSLTSNSGSLAADQNVSGANIAFSAANNVAGTGMLSATDLSANSASGSVSLTNASNAVSTVQGSGSTGFEYVNNGDLALSAAVDGGTGDVSLTSNNGSVTADQNVSGANIAFSAANNVAGTGQMTTAGTLTADATSGSVTLNNVSNNAATVSGTANGDFGYTSGASFIAMGVTSTTGNVDLTATAGDITLDGVEATAGSVLADAQAGSIGVDGMVTAGTDVDLDASDSISGAGQIAATDLMADATSGSVSLTNASNSVSTVRGSGATGFEYVNDGNLSLSGAVAGGTGAASLTSTNGSLIAGEDVSGADISLSAANNVSGTGQMTTAGTLTADATTGSVTLANVANNAGALDATAGNGIIYVDADALDVQAADGGAGATSITTQSGLLTVSGNVGGAGVQLTSLADGITNNGAVSSSAGPIVYVADGDITGAGSHSGAALGASSTSGMVALTGNSNTVLSVSGSAATGFAYNSAIGLNLTNVMTAMGDVNVNAALSNINASDVTATAGSINLGASFGSIAVAGPLTAGTDISLTASSNVTGAGQITATDLVVNATTGNVDLSNALNDVATIQGGAGNSFTYVDANDLGTSGAVAAASGDLNLTATNGSLAVDNALSAAANMNLSALNDVAGMGQLTGQSLNAIATNGMVDLGNAANDMASVQGSAGTSFSYMDANDVAAGGAIAANGGDVTLVAVGGSLTLDNDVSATGNMALGADQNITGTGQLTAVELLATATNGEVNLSNTANDVDLIQGVAGTDFLYADADDIAVNAGGLNAVAGNLTLTSDAGSITADNEVRAGQAITLTAANDVTGTGLIVGQSLDANATSGMVALANASNDVDSLSGTAGTSFTFADVDDLSVADGTAVNAGGPIDLDADGQIEIAGTVSSTGDSVTIDSASEGVTVAATGLVESQASDVSLTGATAVNIAGAASADGTLTANAGTSIQVDGMADANTGDAVLNAMGGDLNIGATGSVTSAMAGVDLDASGAIGIAGTASAEVGLTADAGTSIRVEGMASANTGDAVLNAMGGDLDVVGGGSVRSMMGLVDLDATGDMSLDGSVEGETSVSGNAGRGVSVSGFVSSNTGNTTLDAADGHLIVQGGGFVGSDAASVDLTASGDIIVDGFVFGSTDVNGTAGLGVLVTGNVTADMGNASLTALNGDVIIGGFVDRSEIEGSGVVSYNGDVNLTALIGEEPVYEETQVRGISLTAGNILILEDGTTSSVNGVSTFTADKSITGTGSVNAMELVANAADGVVQLNGVNNQIRLVSGSSSIVDGSAESAIFDIVSNGEMAAGAITALDGISLTADLVSLTDGSDLSILEAPADRLNPPAGPVLISLNGMTQLTGASSVSAIPDGVITLFNGDVVVGSAGGGAGQVASLSALNTPMIFNGDLYSQAGQSNSLTIASALAPSIGLDGVGTIATTPIVFTGNLGTTAGDTTTFRFGDLTIGSTLAGVPEQASILFSAQAPDLSNGLVSFAGLSALSVADRSHLVLANGDITFGGNQKVTAFGNLTFDTTGGSANLGDLTVVGVTGAEGNLTINAPVINFNPRVPGLLQDLAAEASRLAGVAPSLESDDTVDVVAANSINLSTAPVGLNGVQFATSDGFNPGGLTVVTGGTPIQSFSPDGTPITLAGFFLSQAPGSLGFLIPFDLTANGPTNLSLGESLAGAVPVLTDLPVPEIESGLSANDIADLQQIGYRVNPTPAIAAVSAGQLFADASGGPDPRNTDEITVTVSDRRVPLERLQAVLSAYRSVADRGDEAELNASQGLPTTDEASRGLIDTYVAYLESRDQGEAMSFRAFVELARAGDDAQLALDAQQAAIAIDRALAFSDTLNQLGLTEFERAIPKMRTLRNELNLGGGAYEDSQIAQLFIDMGLPQVEVERALGAPQISAFEAQGAPIAAR